MVTLLLLTGFLTLASSFLVVWLWAERRHQRWKIRDLEDQWSTEHLALIAAERRAETEQRRADLALDRLVALTTAAPPVSKPGIEERQEALAEQRRRESEMAELFAPETGDSPTAEMETTDRIV